MKPSSTEKIVTEQQYKNRKVLLSVIKSIGYIVGGAGVFALGVVVVGVVVSVICKLFMLGFSV